MSAAPWVIVGILAAGLTLLALEAARSRHRAARLAARVDALEARVGDVDTTSAQALDTARDAAARARRAAGDAEPAGPRVVLEPVTGPLVKAVALSAGARRTVHRLTRAARGRSA
ncbi:MAG TPA: hypothetical protein VI462_00920 [Acidimicrobiia bacterium]